VNKNSPQEKRNRTMSGKGLFVTGTDTGVGKTLVAGGIAACLKARGISVGVMKPVETGCAMRKGKRIPRDGSLLRLMAGSQEPLDRIVPYRLTAPLAPQVAAEREGVRISMARISSEYRKISSRHEITLVEGAGGLFVPITRRSCMVEVMVKLGVPVLLVGRIGLGTLNHSLLSLECLLRRGIPVIGIVLNDPDKTRGLAAQTNPSVLQQWSPAPLLGNIPFMEGLLPGKSCARRVEHQVEKHVRMDLLIRKAMG